MRSKIAPPVQLTSKGHVILATFEREDGAIDALLMTGRKREPFVMVRKYDKERDTWRDQRCYSTLQQAWSNWSLFYCNGCKGEKWDDIPMIG